ncbi:MAG: hypothetical protein D4R73_07520 [Deltaproteobacteria bacterium]|nr:MAG: hypothetical protein D4R73_07520 [Deltaproteobacteria bacterium]
MGKVAIDDQHRLVMDLGGRQGYSQGHGLAPSPRLAEQMRKLFCRVPPDVNRYYRKSPSRPDGTQDQLIFTRVDGYLRPGKDSCMPPPSV